MLKKVVLSILLSRHFPFCFCFIRTLLGVKETRVSVSLDQQCLNVHGIPSKKIPLDLYRAKFLKMISNVAYDLLISNSSL